jgi:hypothetical protein
LMAFCLRSWLIYLHFVIGLLLPFISNLGIDPFHQLMIDCRVKGKEDHFPGPKQKNYCSHFRGALFYFLLSNRQKGSLVGQKGYGTLRTLFCSVAYLYSSQHIIS